MNDELREAWENTKDYRASMSNVCGTRFLTLVRPKVRSERKTPSIINWYDEMEEDYNDGY